MITTFFLKITTGFLMVVGWLLPNCLIWPDIIREIFTYCFETIATLDFIFPIFDSVIPALHLYLWFWTIYLHFVVAFFAINYIRGRSQ